MGDLVRVDSFGGGPGGHDVVHHSLAQFLGHLVQLHELPDVVEHLVVPGTRRVQLLHDSRHISKYGSIQKG